MTTIPAEQPVSVPQTIKTLPGPYKPQDLVTANDTILRVALFDGEFPWHEHDEDELFLCWNGTFRIDLEGHTPVTLNAGEVFVVPRGLRHRPVAERPAHVVMIERPETRQYGNQKE